MTLSDRSTDFTANARRLGLGAVLAVALLMVGNAITLAAGCLTLPSPDQQIGNPLVTILEIQIIVMMPGMVPVHAWTPSEQRTLSLTAVIFMSASPGVAMLV